VLETSDNELDAIKQICLMRKFDLKQATEVVHVVGLKSPFDKVALPQRLR
jgi:hypothetical protein